MTISDVVMVGAVILGPILAVQAQKLIEAWKQKKDRKTWVFKTLMATRGTQLSPAHVQALNMIDLEFSPKKPKEHSVLDAWKVYLDHLAGAPRDFQDPNYQAQLVAWSTRSNDCHVELLYVMSLSLGYDFDKVHLKKGAYTPKGHADIELEQTLLRRGSLDLLYGKRALPVEFSQRKQQG
jgi:hypothetical protein